MAYTTVLQHEEIFTEDSYAIHLNYRDGVLFELKNSVACITNGRLVCLDLVAHLDLEQRGYTRK